MSDGHITEVEFGLTNNSFPFIELTGQYDCTIELLNILPAGPEYCSEYFRISGVSESEILEFSRGFTDVDAYPISTDEVGSVFEFTVPHWCPVSRLTKAGGIIRSVVAEQGEARITAEILPGRAAGSLISSFLDTYPTATLERKTVKQRNVPVLSSREVHKTMQSRLTPRQQEVVETAYTLGYYEQPRQASGEEVAEQLGIAQSTFCQHLRRGEQKLMQFIFNST